MIRGPGGCNLPAAMLGIVGRDQTGASIVGNRGDRRLIGSIKDFVGKKPRTRAGITRSGRRAFERHVTYLRELLDAGSSASD